jgi:hypothetical protein
MFYRFLGKELTAMTYMKLVTGSVKHLATGDQPAPESITLCGCTVTRSLSWRRVGRLEGDECPRCAELAFGSEVRVRSNGAAGSRPRVDFATST